MKTLNQFLCEAEEKARVAIEGFLDKIYNCKTVDGVSELEKFYSKRKTEVNISDSEDIQIRDALSGRKKEIEAQESADAEGKKVDL
ncbi:UvsW.1 conserved hypothetical protein [Aeromonas phage phiAS5]|uniref:UvsW.1 domain-containing protein n=1 Tax=Aeromonas phage phiAS5 TaxID=879630 RepID=E1A2D5_9CAUD|nr:DNA helicase [Aeromonas phage phiAS5]ADM79881.1 UvsW.1 conserved hypothetical protein [Aeromonas phage phiAS5]BES53013.1 hypothetical protein [Aeromonas phage phiWae14]